MEAFAFRHGLEKEICNEIIAWSSHTLEKPNPLFNNLPPCPYARKAWMDGRVAILFKYENNYQTIYTTISQFDDNFDLVIVVDLEYNPDSEAFHEYLDQINEAISLGIFIDRDVWLMGFHPEDDPNEYLDHDGFESFVSDEYAMIFIQRLSKVVQASENLKRLGYYEEYGKEYNIDEVLERRETLYRRLKDGDESP